MKIILDNGIEILIPKELDFKLLATGIMDLDEVECNTVEVALGNVKVPFKKPNVSLTSDNESGDKQRRSFTDAERDNIIEMRKRGFSAREISKKMGCKPQKIDQYLYQLRKKGLLSANGPVKEEDNLEDL